jgi:hypothetical protein
LIKVGRAAMKSILDLDFVTGMPLGLSAQTHL